MAFIIQKENYFVAIDEDIDQKKIPNQYRALEIGQDYSLLGGRIKLIGTTGLSGYPRYDVECMLIDGIQILKLEISKSLNAYFEVELTPTVVATYLTQCFQLGVDTFLENYKKSLEEARQQYHEIATRLEMELSTNPDEKKETMLTSIRKKLLVLIALICSLSINLSVGLDNHVYEDNYNEIINICL